MATKELSPSRLNLQTYDVIAKQWTARNFNRDKAEQEIQRFVGLLRTGKSILDVGCGPGKHTKQLLALGCAVISIDFSEEMLKEGKRLVPEGDFRLMDMRHLEFEVAKFDGLISFASLLHIEKKEVENVLEGFNRILKTGGILAVSVREGEGERIEDDGGVRRFFSRYTLSELTEFLQKAGFRVLETSVSVGESSGKPIWLVTFAEKA